MTMAITFSSQNDVGSCAHYLVLRKSRIRGRPRLRISSSLLTTSRKQGQGKRDARNLAPFSPAPGLHNFHNLCTLPWNRLVFGGNPAFHCKLLCMYRPLLQLQQYRDLGSRFGKQQTQEFLPSDQVSFTPGSTRRMILHSVYLFFSNLRNCQPEYNLTFAVSRKHDSKSLSYLMNYF